MRLKMKIDHNIVENNLPTMVLQQILDHNSTNLTSILTVTGQNTRCKDTMFSHCSLEDIKLI